MQLVKSAEEVAAVADRLLGGTLVTIQTGAEGQTVRQVFVEAGCDIGRELYLGIVLDRAEARPVLMVSSEGGVEIETGRGGNARADLQGTLRSGGRHRELPDSQALPEAGNRRRHAFAAPTSSLRRLCRVFVDYDCSLVEINPLVVTKSGELVALDAKITFDDNAMFRHKDVAGLRDLSEEDPAELRAGEAGLSYVNLDGNIGCLVNGAGPGDGDDGHYQVARRRTGQLSRRRRRRQDRTSDRGLSHLCSTTRR